VQHIFDGAVCALSLAIGFRMAWRWDVQRSAQVIKQGLLELRGEAWVSVRDEPLW